MKTQVRKKTTRGNGQAVAPRSGVMRRILGEEQAGRHSVPQRIAYRADEKKGNATVQSKDTAGNQTIRQTVPLALETRIDGFRYGGQPLPGRTRAFMENRFARNFNRVRVHDNSSAAFAARSLGARAFTLGENIVFGAGQYAPESREGRHLLAHELTHTVQQGKGGTENLAPELLQRQEDRREERRTRRRVESDRRRRRPEGGRNRDRREGGDFDSDWAGRAILYRYLTGGGDWSIRDNPDWSRYMKANPSLQNLLASKVRRMASDFYKSSKPAATLSENFPAGIENGEGIIGYQYLHGTNVNAGDFQIEGGAVRVKNNGIAISLTYTWNDIIDPNPQYWTDNMKSFYAELFTLGMAEGYQIHITWTEAAELLFDARGKIIKASGWPFV